MDMKEIIISLLKEGDEIPSKTILFQLVNNNLIHSSFSYEFEMANDKYIRFNEVTFLHVSVFYNRMDVCRELVMNGAKATTLCVDGQPVLNLLDLYLDNYHNLHDEYKMELDIQFLASLLSKNEITSFLYRNSLCNYNIISILLDFGANPNDYRALDMIQHDDILFRIFLGYGFDVNARDEYGNTFLHLCADHGTDEETIRWLLENGADKTYRNTDGKTPYECFVERIKDCEYNDFSAVHLLQI